MFFFDHQKKIFFDKMLNAQSNFIISSSSCPAGSNKLTSSTYSQAISVCRHALICLQKLKTVSKLQRRIKDFPQNQKSLRTPRILQNHEV